MKKVSITLIILLTIISGCKLKKVGQKQQVYQIDVPEGQDATPIVVKAIKECKETGIKQLEFPKGTYHFYPTFAPDRYCAITNNDNGLKRTSFPIIGFDGFEINGNDSEFIFHGKMLPFIIEESKDVRVSNLSINWEVPFCLEGDVVANNAAEKSFDVKIKTPYKISDGHLYLSLEREDSPYEKMYGFRFAKGEKYDLLVGQNIFWNPKTMAPIYNHVKYSGFDVCHFVAHELEPGLIRLKTPYELVPPIGSVFCSKGEYLHNRQNPAFRLFKSQNLFFSNVNVHHAGAMGMIAERCEDITLDSFNVVLKDGDGRMVTTTADATHFCNCRGLITIRNCTFENMLDDATNIHGTYVRVNKVLDDYRIAVETYHPHQNDYLFGEVGDSVRIIHQHTLMPTSSALVLANVERINEKISILTFNESVKGKVEPYFGVENISWYPKAIIENNVVRNNRARSFLISTPRKVLVRNNQFSSQMHALLITGDLGLWNESGPCDSLIIENNVFGDCVYGGNGQQAVIHVGPHYDSPDHMKGYYSRSIIIKDNQFRTFDSSILFALSVDGLVFENNDMSQSTTYKPIYPEVPSLRIINCNDVIIEANSYQSIDGGSATLSVDEKTTNVNISEKSVFNNLKSKL